MSKTHQEKAIENLVGKAVTLLSPQAQPFFLLAILSLLPLILPEAAGAQPTPPVGPSPPVTWVAPVSVPGGAGNGIIDEFRNLLTRLADTVGLRARQLLLFLFTVDIVLTIGKATMAGSSFADLLSRFIYRLLFVAFVLFITRYASDIVDMVTNAAITLANDASEGGEAIDPSVSGIIGDGATRAFELLGRLSIWEPLSIFYVLAAVLTLVITAVQVGMVVTIYAELYIVALAGMIVLGFGGLEIAKDSAITYVKTIIGKGLNLMTLLIIFTLVTTVVLEISDRPGSTYGAENVINVLILQIVAILLMLSVPASVEGLAGGIGSSMAARMVGTAIAGVAIAMAAAPVLAAMKGAAAGAAGAAGGGLKGGLSAMGKGGGLGGIAKGAAQGAARTGGRYAKAGATRGGSIAGELGKDSAAAGNALMNILKGGGS